MNTNKAFPSKQRLLADNVISEKIRVTKAALADYAAFCLENQDRLHPEATLIRLRSQLRELTNPSEVGLKLGEIREFESPAAPAVAEIYRTLALKQFEPAHKALLDLMNTAAAKLEDYGAEAAQAEALFYKEHGVSENRPTEVRNRHIRALAELVSCQNAWSAPPTVLPNAEHTVLTTFFGVALLD